MVTSEVSARAHRRPRKRVKTGCLTCRARKVKCDETHAICNKCRSLSVECRWPEGLSGLRPSAVLIGMSFKTGSRSPACFTCRFARSRCSQTRPSCDRCILHGHECSYPEPPGSRSLTSSARAWIKRYPTEESELGIPELPAVPEDASTEVPDTDVQSLARDISALPSDVSNPGQRPAPLDVEATSPSLPTQDRIERLAAIFFSHVHMYRANSFLHRERTLTAIRDAVLPTSITLAICAVAARFVTPPEPDLEAKRWTATAGDILTTSTEVSRDNIDVALLLAIYMQQAGRIAQYHLWANIAMNQAIQLGLHRESTASERSFVDSERDRRLFFACYSLDRFVSNGTPETIRCPSSRIKLRLPCAGFNWRLDVSVQTPYACLETDDSHIPTSAYGDVGAMGFWVRLVGVRLLIKQYFNAFREYREETSQAVAQGRDDSVDMPVAPWEQHSLYAHCIARLDSLRTSIPPRLRLSRETIARRHDSPALGQTVMLYLWWNLCCIELSSMAIPGYTQSLNDTITSGAPPFWLDECRRNALKHAEAITDILALVHASMPGQPLIIYDHTIAHAVYLSIRVQLELLPNPGDEATSARLKGRFETMLSFVQDTSRFFRPVHLVLKEMRHLLASYGVFDSPYPDRVSRAESPPFPWLRRQKKLDSQRADNERAKMDTADSEAIRLELLPDFSSFPDSYWLQGFDIDALSPLELMWNEAPNSWATTQADLVHNTAHPPPSMVGLDDWLDVGTVQGTSRSDPLLP